MIRIIHASWRWFLWRSASILIPQQLHRDSVILIIWELETLKTAHLRASISRIFRRVFRRLLGKSVLFFLSTPINFFYRLYVKVYSRKIAKVTIGIVVVSHRLNPFLIEALNSIKFQTRVPDSVILVLSECEVTRELIDQIQEIEIHNLEVVSVPDATAASNRNYGASLLQTDYVVFLDGDDVLRKNAFECFYFNLISGNEIVLGSSCNTFPSLTFYYVAPRITHEMLVRNNQLNITAAIKLDTFKSLNGFRESGIYQEHLPEDWDFWCRLTKEYGPIKTISTVLFSYRQHPSSTTSTYNWLPEEKREFWHYAVTSGETIYWRQPALPSNPITLDYKPNSLTISLARDTDFILICANNLADLRTLMCKIQTSPKDSCIGLVLDAGAKDLFEFEEELGISIFNLNLSFLRHGNRMIFLDSVLQRANEIYFAPNCSIKRLALALTSNR